MNKNVLIAIVAILVIAVLGVGAYMLLNNKEQAKSIDIEAAQQTLSNAEPFSLMATMDITKEELNTMMGINADNVEKVYGKLPLMNVQSSLYVLIQAKEGKVDTVKAELDKYAESYEQQWSRYLPDQHEYVQNRKTNIVGNTIYMIISENSTELEQEITK